MEEKVEKKRGFGKALKAFQKYAKQFGILVLYTDNLKKFFKGDLNGKEIFIRHNLKKSEKLFNLVHLFGHTVQWNLDPELRELGSVLHKNVSDELLLKLQNYEWQANCYGLQALHAAGFHQFDKWLFEKYAEDIYYLTNYYKTGQKVKEVTETSKLYEFSKPLVPLEFAPFTAVRDSKSRDGIVIDW
jgi:hypothetical protein